MDRGRLWAERKSSDRRMDSRRQRDWWMVSRPLGEMPPHLGQLLGVLLDDGEDILPKDVQRAAGRWRRRCP